MYVSFLLLVDPSGAQSAPFFSISLSAALRVPRREFGNRDMKASSQGGA